MDDEFDFVIVTPKVTSTRKQLRARFYNSNRYLTQDWGNPRKYITTANPITLVDQSSLGNDIWDALYRDGYRVKITMGNSQMFGPHKAELELFVAGQILWLGTCQMIGNFFDTKGLLKQLRKAIASHAYFMSDSSARDVIDITPKDKQEDIVVDSAENHYHPKLKRKSGKIRLLPSEVEHCPKCGVFRKTAGGLRRHGIQKHNLLFLFMYETAESKALRLGIKVKPAKKQLRKRKKNA